VEVAVEAAVDLAGAGVVMVERTAPVGEVTVTVTAPLPVVVVVVVFPDEDEVKVTEGTIWAVEADLGAGAAMAATDAVREAALPVAAEAAAVLEMADVMKRSPNVW